MTAQRLTTPQARNSELRGPDFGSYAPDEVTWLLKDLSHIELEADLAVRERRIQSGTAHYAESLPIEYQPGAAYQQLFADTLDAVSYTHLTLPTKRIV